MVVRPLRRDRGRGQPNIASADLDLVVAGDEGVGAGCVAGQHVARHGRVWLAARPLRLVQDSLTNHARDKPNHTSNTSGAAYVGMGGLVTAERVEAAAQRRHVEVELVARLVLGPRRHRQHRLGTRGVQLGQLPHAKR